MTALKFDRALPLLLAFGLSSTLSAIDFSSEQSCLFVISSGLAVQTQSDAKLFSVSSTLRMSTAKRLEVPTMPETGAEKPQEFAARIEITESPSAALELGADWPLVDWFSRRQIDVSGGISRFFVDRRSTVGLEYSDVFETGADPDLGGHGFSLLLRYSFH